MSAAMVSFRGPTAPAWVLDGLRSGTIGAVCLFNYNFTTLTELRDLNLSLMAAAAAGGFPPPIIGIDQEGGQLMAVGHGATQLPGNMALGAADSVELARRTGEVLAQELLALGCNMNFAPVLDLATQLDNDAMGVRSFGSDPAAVGRLGAALIRGMQGAGVLATAKHFPGHGDTAVDSHLAAPIIRAPLAVLTQRELPPFQAAIAAEVAAVMTCHAVYPALDPERIATHSRAILHDLLRTQLGFEGLVITDALDMSGVGDMAGFERALRAVQAGADLCLLGHLPDQEQIVSRLLPYTDPASAQRVMAVRRRLPTSLPPLSLIGAPEHQEVARATAAAAITAVRGEPRLATTQRVLLVAVQAGELTPAETATGSDEALPRALLARLPHATVLRLRRGADRAQLDALLDQIGAWLKHDALQGEVVVATVNASSDPVQLALLERLCALGADPLLLALRGPLDVASAPCVRRALASYGRRAPQAEALVAVLCGDQAAPGALPVTLPVDGVTGAPT